MLLVPPYLPHECRKSASQLSLQATGWQGSGQQAELQGGGGAPRPPLSSGHNRTNSNGKPPSCSPSPSSTLLYPSLPRADMLLYEPMMEHQLHSEPLSDVLVSESVIYTADHSGCIRTWARPS